MKKEKFNLDLLTPKQIVLELNKYIVGQSKAKRAVAVALRNRIRRLKLDPEIREDIAPKNILMIGPTGVGKTEIARRLAKLSGSPFIKVEATKYTEVGYVGRDVESMVRDLMSAGFSMVKQEMQESVKSDAQRRAEEVLLDLLLPGSDGKRKKNKMPKPTIKPVRSFSFSPSDGSGPGSIMGAAIQVGIPIVSSKDNKNEQNEADKAKESADREKQLLTREKFREMLRAGELEDRTVEIDVTQEFNMPTFGMMGGGFEEIESSLSGIANIFGGGNKKKVLPVKRAREILINQEAEKLIDNDRLTEEARNRVQEMGIIFIDEIDKIAAKTEGGGHDVSREGVQRDILPIVEGATVNTKYGPVDTSHILFIAAGAFNISKPSDLIPELQGRFPLRVELDSLHKEDFLRILTEPKNALTRQYKDLLGTENIGIEFMPESIDMLADIAAKVNSTLENIGARRLHTIMESLLEDIAFDAPDIAPTKVVITPDFVNERLKGLAEDHDLGRYIL
ncbi:MAG: ATP-dependent protease ATPase subunit HslU [Spirochaetaceae bacterium]|jgi:ATP-dependent HslUV protease ATP-binding subunit HslU|nr:ATP-dependent protease ATPase subunit HslU [Spirochaetaceae bacterium]GMO18007.1 MAG: ATP-dependent protease ATPase subunit HslU [Termitinemataceae bacterium]